MKLWLNPPPPLTRPLKSHSVYKCFLLCLIYSFHSPHVTREGKWRRREGIGIGTMALSCKLDILRSFLLIFICLCLLIVVVLNINLNMQLIQKLFDFFKTLGTFKVTKIVANTRYFEFGQEWCLLLKSYNFCWYILHIISWLTIFCYVI